MDLGGIGQPTVASVPSGNPFLSHAPVGLSHVAGLSGTGLCGGILPSGGSDGSCKVLNLTLHLVSGVSLRFCVRFGAVCVFES